MLHAETLRQQSNGAVPLIRAFRICWRVIRPQSTACPSAWRMKFSPKCQRELPKLGPQVRQDYGLGTHSREGDLSREINTPKNLDVRVRVGWVKGLNRLYFLYEAYDNYWDFSLPGLHNDIFEVVVDGDLSSGPLIDIYHRDVWTPEAVGKLNASIHDLAVRTPNSCIMERMRRTTTYHSARGRQGLGDGVGLSAISKGASLRERGLQLQLQAGRTGKAGSRVLDHTVRLCGLRGSAAKC